MVKESNQSGFSVLYILIILLVLGVVVASGFVLNRQREVRNEKKVFDEASAQITQLTNDAAKFAPSSKEVARQCRYLSAKYDKGRLSCMISGKVSYVVIEGERDQIVGKINMQRKELPWKFEYDNTRNLLKDYSPLGVLVYSYESLTCAVTYGYKTTGDGRGSDSARDFSVEYDCSGAAQKEYYPVVDY